MSFVKSQLFMKPKKLVSLLSVYRENIVNEWKESLSQAEYWKN